MNRMIHRLIDNAKDAIEDVNNNKNDEFYEGKKAAYYEMLDSLKNDLEIEDADIKGFGLDIDLDAMIEDHRAAFWKRRMAWNEANENISFQERDTHRAGKKQMKRLCDYLDSDLVRIELKNGISYLGVPIDVTYADESENGEDQITIEDPNIRMRLHTVTKSNIKKIVEIG